MQEQMNTNPFANYTLAIADSYQDMATGLVNAGKKPKRRTYKTITALLEESFFLGATKFGDNFIA